MEVTVPTDVALDGNVVALAGAGRLDILLWELVSTGVS